MTSLEHRLHHGGEEESKFERLKHWVEKRFAHRRAANVSVLVLQGTRVQSGLLCDVSETGFGLCKISQLVPDELVSATTDDGQVLEGRVVWALGDRAGISLLSRG